MISIFLFLIFGLISFKSQLFGFSINGTCFEIGHIHNYENFQTKQSALEDNHKSSSDCHDSKSAETFKLYPVIPPLFVTTFKLFLNLKNENILKTFKSPYLECPRRPPKYIV